MAKSEPQIFSGITPENYATLIQKAQSAGLNLTGNSGKATKFGVELSWSYSPERLELTIQCLGTPLFVKPEQVNAKIQALMKQALDQAQPIAG
jgi:hypothetical protein